MAKNDRVWCLRTYRHRGLTYWKVMDHTGRIVCRGDQGFYTIEACERDIIAIRDFLPAVRPSQRKAA